MGIPRRLGRRALTAVSVLGAALAAVLAIAIMPAPTPASAQAGVVTLEWFGWSHFRLTSPNGKIILLNPFLTNPDSTMSLDDLSNVQLILPADGHPDETGQTAEIAIKTGAKVFAPFELGTYLMGPAKNIPAAQVVRAAPGARLVMDGITVRMVTSEHGSGFGSTAEGATLYGGPAVGFYITFEN